MGLSDNEWPWAHQHLTLHFENQTHKAHSLFFYGGRDKPSNAVLGRSVVILFLTPDLALPEFSGELLGQGYVAVQKCWEPVCTGLRSFSFQVRFWPVTGVLFTQKSLFLKVTFMHSVALYNFGGLFGIIQINLSHEYWCRRPWGGWGHDTGGQTSPWCNSAPPKKGNRNWTRWKKLMSRSHLPTSLPLHVQLS